MRRFVEYRILRAFAVLAALAQFAVGGFAAAASPADLARIICLPSGSVSSAAADNALSDLIDALNLEGENAPDAMGGGCALCVLAHAAPPAAPAASNGTGLPVIAADPPPANEAAVKQTQRGPPIGGRAPPFSS